MDPIIVPLVLAGIASQTLVRIFGKSDEIRALEIQAGKDENQARCDALIAYSNAYSKYLDLKSKQLDALHIAHSELLKVGRYEEASNTMRVIEDTYKSSDNAPSYLPPSGSSNVRYLGSHS